MYFTITSSPYGDIALTANDQGLTALSFQQGALPLVIDDSYSEAPSISLMFANN